MLQLSSEVAPLEEKEFLKWSKAEDWCELKEREEEQLLGLLGHFCFLVEILCVQSRVHIEYRKQKYFWKYP